MKCARFEFLRQIFVDFFLPSTTKHKISPKGLADDVPTASDPPLVNEVLLQRGYVCPYFKSFSAMA